MLDGRLLNFALAMPRAKLDELQAAKAEKVAKDTRNLHLMRLGVVRAGTHAAAGMSASDARRREQIDVANRKKLTSNLHVFVSPTRLVVHNLPRTLTDKELLRIVTESVPDATVRECRIWRDRHDVSATSGAARSMGFAFVEFAEHKHALACLTALNNNAHTFTDEKRPIVEFALENRIALNKKLARVERQQKQDGRKPTQQRGQLVVDDVQATKAALQKRGVKAMSSHTGAKVRHKDGRGARRAAKPAKNAKTPAVSEARAKKTKKTSRSAKRQQKSGDSKKRGSATRFLAV